ncbi:MAG: NUDIX domain-containing protein [Gammaproteobacteria bacterium]|nr:NUDIX domain-containing protein [Gammaproteobacteria bacterium]NNF50181.1 NUDIX domain-containing protein [Woeseiaceae bacterium]MBT8094484.1 NUDIX domain-containing protein [Gammaproteobacteria bacterium]MBT8104484.1 NUDIX domain-containing protein [Gammaproteobacteria bacterium]NNK24498.1 NUDIX domain-containing protein [Woeseiaceae bacterium]
MSETRLSCGVVLARQTEGGWATLLLRAWHHWDFPKGIRESGEDPLQAAIREVGEETGITAMSFDWGERFFETGPYSRGKIARYFIARTTQDEVVMGLSPETGEPEHQEWRWVSFDEAYDLGSPRVRQIVQWARQVIGA